MLPTLLALFGACGEPAAYPVSIAPEDYDHSCSASEDCVAAELANVCGCADGAINVADSARYVEERTRLRAQCTSQADCLAVLVACNDGTCELVR
jgi:hypothetical protein